MVSSIIVSSGSHKIKSNQVLNKKLDEIKNQNDDGQCDFSRIDSGEFPPVEN